MSLREVRSILTNFLAREEPGSKVHVHVVAQSKGESIVGLLKGNMGTLVMPTYDSEGSMGYLPPAVYVHIKKRTCLSSLLPKNWGGSKPSRGE